eukprot:285618_1
MTTRETKLQMENNINYTILQTNEDQDVYTDDDMPSPHETDNDGYNNNQLQIHINNTQNNYESIDDGSLVDNSQDISPNKTPDTPFNEREKVTQILLEIYPKDESLINLALDAIKESTPNNPAKAIQWMLNRQSPQYTTPQSSDNQGEYDKTQQTISTGSTTTANTIALNTIEEKENIASNNEVSNGDNYNEEEKYELLTNYEESDDEKKDDEKKDDNIQIQME